LIAGEARWNSTRSSDTRKAATKKTRPMAINDIDHIFNVGTTLSAKRIRATMRKAMCIPAGMKSS